MLPMVLGMLLVLSLNRIEHYFFPVVTEFTVIKMQRAEGGLLVSGYMRKARNCQFVGATAKTQNGTELGLQFMDFPIHNASRAPGSQAWGPWQIYLPLEPAAHTVHLSAVHTCHGFWASTTGLVTLPIIEYTP